MVLKTIEEAIRAASAGKQRKVLSVAVPEDPHTLEAVLRAAREGYVKPLLVGNRDKILEIVSNDLKTEIEDEWVIDKKNREEAADEAVALVRDGKADFLMKGSINTAEIMRAVLNKEHGLPHEKLITDIAITELPWYHKLLFFADGGLVVYPTLEQKAAMIRLIVDSMHRLGYGDHIKVGILCVAETFSPKIQESVDAVELKRMNREGEITGCIVEGPISLDLAMKPDVARAKQYESPCAGDVDVLIMPNLVTGNVYSKSIEMLGAEPLGIITGAKCPIVCVSRGAPAELKYKTIVMASMLA
ncbi:MAG: phosphate acyltransferase [Clostridium sp.]|nr:phosphate acyltransferase [Clostridium sp.]